MYPCILGRNWRNVEILAALTQRPIPGKFRLFSDLLTYWRKKQTYWTLMTGWLKLLTNCDKILNNVIWIHLGGGCWEARRIQELFNIVSSPGCADRCGDTWDSKHFQCWQIQRQIQIQRQRQRQKISILCLCQDVQIDAVTHEILNTFNVVSWRGSRIAEIWSTGIKCDWTQKDKTLQTSRHHQINVHNASQPCQPSYMWSTGPHQADECANDKLYTCIQCNVSGF